MRASEDARAPNFGFCRTSLGEVVSRYGEVCRGSEFAITYFTRADANKLYIVPVRVLFVLFSSFALASIHCSSSPRKSNSSAAATGANADAMHAKSTDNVPDEADEEKDLVINDPWEGFNRKIHAFNDLFFRYLMKPVAQGWNFITPAFLRQGINNFFNWAYTPGRLVSNLLQAKLTGAGRETAQFVINGTVGMLGFYNASKEIFSLEQTNEDFDQVFGKWGIPEGPYIVWPFIGPYTVRGTFGFGGDVTFQPQTILVPVYIQPRTIWVDIGLIVGFYSARAVNRFSLDPDEYDNLIKDSIDPYVFIRDIYLQNTRKNVAD